MTNLDQYGMFDYVADNPDTEYSTERFSRFLEPITGSGVVAGEGDEMAASAVGLNLTVGTGVCYIKGRYGEITTAKVLAIDPVSPDTERKDYIVVKLDTSAQAIGLEVIPGTQAASAVAPSLTPPSTSVVYLPLYLVTVGDDSSLSIADVRALCHLRSRLTSVTLAAASWTGAEAPFSYVLAVPGVTATSPVEIIPGLSITADQLEALQAANLQDGGQEAGSVTLKAFGDKPTIALPIRAIVRRDM